MTPHNGKAEGKDCLKFVSELVKKVTLYRAFYIPLQRNFEKIKKMKKKLFIFFMFVGIVSSYNIYAQTDSLVRLRFNTRFDFSQRINTDDMGKSASSMDGKYLNLMLDGNINEQWSYHYRQRLMQDGLASYRSFFNATDFLYLRYQFRPNFYVSGGKEIVAIGGFEYDAAPIDVYFASHFWNHVICYQLGASVGYVSNDKRHNVAFQITNSPFTTATAQSLYAYNLIWYGNMRKFHTIYSLNRIEYMPSEYINYFTFGNRWDNGKFKIDFDFQQRIPDELSLSSLNNYTIVAELAYRPNQDWNLFAKAGYDENSTQSSWNKLFVEPGTERFFYGAGVEYFPIKQKRNIRLHGFVMSDNTEPRNIFVNLGVKWEMDVYRK